MACQGAMGLFRAAPYAPWRPPHPRRFRALPPSAQVASTACSPLWLQTAHRAVCLTRRAQKTPTHKATYNRLALLAATDKAAPIAALSGEKKVELRAILRICVNAKPRGDLSRRGCVQVSVYRCSVLHGESLASPYWRGSAAASRRRGSL